MARAAALRLTGRSSGASRSRADSVRGVITLLGTAPAVQAVLKVADDADPVTLSGMATSGMQRLAGAEVVVRGVRVSPRDIVVAEYIVRGMKGVPAYDGVLLASDDGYALELSDGTGRKRLASVPGALRGMSGVRVWLAIPSGSSTPQSYGLIRR